MEKIKAKIVRNYIGAASIGVSGLLYIIAGITLLIWKFELPPFIKLVILVYTAILSITSLLACLSKFTLTKLVSGFAPITLGTLIVVNSEPIVSLYSFILGFYLVFIALIKMIDYLILKKNKTPGRLLVLINVIIILAFALPLLLETKMNIRSALLITGIFFIFYGLTNLGDFIVELLPIKQSNRFKSRVRVNLPVIMTSFLPKKGIEYINALLAVDDDGIIEEQSFKSDDKPDLEVFIHVTEEGFGSMGHGDICFEGKIYCYGNYDHLSGKLFGSIGDGVLFTVEDRDQYIDFCAKSTKDSIFSFGLKLTDTQIEDVRESIEELFSHVYPWKPLMQKYEENNALFDKTPDDYASRLYESTRAKLYKFKDTSFKTYFVMTTNCVKLADRIIRATGIAAANPNGILSPGAYYEFFDRQYRLKNSIVISKQTYHHSANIKHE